jgi:hypothetical protein
MIRHIAGRVLSLCLLLCYLLSPQAALCSCDADLCRGAEQAHHSSQPIDSSPCSDCDLCPCCEHQPALSPQVRIRLMVVSEPLQFHEKTSEKTGVLSEVFIPPEHAA